MNRKVWIIGAAVLLAGFCFLIIDMIWIQNGKSRVLPSSQPVSSPDPALSSPEQNPALIEQRLQEISGWQQAEHRFLTSSQEPRILLQNDNQVVYIQNNQIRYEWLGGTDYQSIPLSFPVTREGYVWRSGNTAYIGLSSPNGGDAAQGDWYEINLGNNTNNPLKRLGEMPITPEQVRTVSFSVKPAGALFLVEQKDAYQEYWIHDAGKGPLYVNDVSYSKAQVDQLMKDESSAGEPDFKLVQELDSVTVLEDARGLLVIKQQQPNLSLFRLTGYRLIQAQTLAGDSGIAAQLSVSGARPVLLVLQSKDSGIFKSVLLPAAAPKLLAYEPRLLEEGWTLFYPFSFVRTNGQRLELLYYPVQEDALPDQISSPEARFLSLPVENSPELTRKETLLTRKSSGMGSSAGSIQVLSLLDVIHDRQSDMNPSYWMDSLPAGKTGQEKPLESALPEKTVRYPKIAAMEDEDQSPSTPAQLAEELQRRDGIGSGDAVSGRTIRQLHNDWYVLTGTQLEKWELSTGLKKVGDWPVKLHCSIRNYSVCSTAADFAYDGGFWFVADTYGDRIVKLEENGTIVDEAAVSMPVKLSLGDRGEWNVTSLQGTVTFTSSLQRLSVQPAEEENVSQKEQTELTLAADAYYENDQGLHWLIYRNYLCIYDANNRTVKTYWTGAMTNALGHARLLPYGRSMLLVFDDRLHVFDHKGNWEKEIKFPRANPDGIYAASSAGENSYAWDEKRGMLYIVQGYRILAIDVENDGVSPLFWQLQANLGQLLMDRGKLYFTMQSASGYETPDPYEELIVIDTQSGGTMRYSIPSGYKAVRITENHELVLVSQAAASGNSSSGTSMSYLLDEQGRPVPVK